MFSSAAAGVVLPESRKRRKDNKINRKNQNIHPKT